MQSRRLPNPALEPTESEGDGVTASRRSNGQSRMAQVAQMFVRFQSKDPRPSGRHPGIFALANGLAHDGRLSPEEWAWWRANNDWFNMAYPSPETVDPSIFDKAIHPHYVLLVQGERDTPPESSAWISPAAGRTRCRVGRASQHRPRHRALRGRRPGCRCPSAVSVKPVDGRQRTNSARARHFTKE